jgi:hypothetical protein
VRICARHFSAALNLACHLDPLQLDGTDAMSNTSRLYDLINALPDAAIAEVVDFAEFLRDKRLMADAPTNNEPLIDLAGGLEASANFSGDPLSLQDRMRDEWN